MKKNMEAPHEVGKWGSSHKEKPEVSSHELEEAAEDIARQAAEQLPRALKSYLRLPKADRPKSIGLKIGQGINDKVEQLVETSSNAELVVKLKFQEELKNLESYVPEESMEHKSDVNDIESIHLFWPDGRSIADAWEKPHS